MVSRRKMGVVIAVSLVMVSAVTLVFVNSPENPAGLHYTFSAVNICLHDANAFTQGLVFDDGFLYERTGLYGNSSLRRVDLETGEVLQSVSLQAQYFGEKGIENLIRETVRHEMARRDALYQTEGFRGEA